MRRLLLYYLTAVLYIALLFCLFIKGDTTLQVMDATGWIFFVASCFGHAAMLLLALLLPALLMSRWHRTRSLAPVVLVGGTALLAMLVTIDMQVYSIYRFHINGIVLDLLFGQNAGEIFTFDAMLYLNEGLILFIVAAVAVALYYLIERVERLFSRRRLKWLLCGVLAIFILANAMHVWGAFYNVQSIAKSKRLIPYYFPLSASKMLKKWGLTPPEDKGAELSQRHTDLCYPLQPIVREQRDKLPNIVLILVDSWSKRTLTQQCMPHVYEYAQANEQYDNHFSCANGTRFAVFGLFTSAPPTYWDDFEADGIQPLFIDQLQQCGYDIRVHASATFENPPFRKRIFGRVEGVPSNTPGDTPLQRDRRITEDFIAELPALSSGDRPFFSMLFYDLPHGIEVPEDSLYRFQPSWKYADYAALSNDTDPVPFFNLYQNVCAVTDGMIGQVLMALRQQHLDENTIVIITGDHAQEFNENHQNFWGHSGNFSRWQIGVPMIVHRPGAVPQRYEHRTTHYDVVPTFMHDYLGVTNPPADYSVGHLLTDTIRRDCHLASEGLIYAFIIAGDTIVEKRGEGTLDVYDRDMRPVTDYHVSPQLFQEMTHCLSYFNSSPK